MPKVGACTLLGRCGRLPSASASLCEHRGRLSGSETEIEQLSIPQVGRGKQMATSALLPAAELLSFLKQTHGAWTERDVSKTVNISSVEAKQAITAMQMQGANRPNKVMENDGSGAGGFRCEDCAVNTRSASKQRSRQPGGRQEDGRGVGRTRLTRSIVVFGPVRTQRMQTVLAYGAPRSSLVHRQVSGRFRGLRKVAHKTLACLTRNTARPSHTLSEIACASAPYSERPSER